MNTERLALQRFLDVEAEVAGESSDSDEYEHDVDFIDNDFQVDSNVNSSRRYLSWNGPPEEDEEFSGFLQNVLRHATRSRETVANEGSYLSRNGPPEEDEEFRGFLQNVLRHATRSRGAVAIEDGGSDNTAISRGAVAIEGGDSDNTAISRGAVAIEGGDSDNIAISNALRSATDRDFPLWRVCCRYGTEEEAVFYLLQRIAAEDEQYELRSAFTRGAIRGWIYLEATMNEELHELLKSTPGVVRRRNGIVREMIGFEDWVKMLTMHDPVEDASVGKWMRVLKGRYKGDVGYVLRAETWGGSCHPTLSGATYPCPSEWIFEEGERVQLVESGRQGVIRSIKPDFAKVELVASEGLVPEPLLLLRKYIVIGDFVEVTSGMLQGQTGWVVSVNNDIASIASPGNQTDTGNSDVEHVKVHINWTKTIDSPFSHAPPPSASTQDLIKRFDRMPWIGTTVVVRKAGHPLKGKQAVVKDVLCGQQTASGLLVVAEVKSFDPMHAFPKFTIDYDDVVEATLGLQLYEFWRPQSELFKPKNFVPCKAPTPHPRPPITLTAPAFPPFPWLPSGSGTPMYEATPTSTPAWDPSSRTPMPEFTTSSPPSSRTHTPPSPTESPQHVLLDPRLRDIKLKVIVNSGHFHNKELVASLMELDGELSLRWGHYASSKYLKPEWVTPKHPNPTRDNGLLVVIKGEHCGKRVRRIHHRYENDRAVMMLAVVEQVDNSADFLTGEQLDLDQNDICVGFETAEEKKLNSSLMSALREEARKIQAK